MNKISSKIWNQSAAVHLIVMSLIWWMLTKDDYNSWILGIPAIALSLFLKGLLGPDEKIRLNIFQILPFTIFFLKQSLLGGVDVIQRAFHPDRPLAPNFIQYHLKIRNTTAKVFFANTVSLLPGTFSVNLEGQEINIHVLDETLSNLENLNILESKIAVLFQEDISDE